MSRDAAALEPAGYYPTAQSWAPGQWSCGDFLGALLLCIVLVGVLIFIYMLIVKPDGITTVTFSLRDAQAAQGTGTASSGSLAERLQQLDAARAAGLLTDDEFTAKRAGMIDKF